ncbi:MAG: DUF4129 domain-containing transglutaminase family protein [Acidimicrobiales bacterium]
MTPGFLPLVLLGAVCAASFARCFNGPGELFLLVPVCVGAHLVAQLARRVSAERSALAGAAIWVVAALLVAWVPVLVLDWGRVAGGLPIGHGRTVLSGQLGRAWSIFSKQTAPVEQVPGLVMAAAWACGAMALATEALDGDGSLPRVVSLIPAFDIVIFTGTLGTVTGRPLELAALGALAVWYLASVVGTRRRDEGIVARVDGRVIPLAVSDGAGTRARRSGRTTAPARRRRVAAVAPGLVVLAGLGAGVVGPLLPGATSAPLVAWHGKVPGNGPNGPGGSGRHGGHGPVIVSSLVRVGEEEVDNPKVVLLTVHSSQLTREVLDVLDSFNGDVWSTSPLREHPAELPQLSGSLRKLAADPPPVSYHQGTGVLTQVITVGDLGGSELPIPGSPMAVGGLSPIETLGPSGPLISAQGLKRDESYSIEASLSRPPPVPHKAVLSSFGEVSSARASPAVSAVSDRAAARSAAARSAAARSAAARSAGATLTSAQAIDLQLPEPVPASITRLAHQVVTRAQTPAEKARLIQQYLADNPSFHYHLPRRLKAGAIADQGEGYAALTRFLFVTRTGYCQQFASAFAVLARIDGLPTRVVVGFLPGPSLGNDVWQITGQQVHAWPQVYFPASGWVDYEPTPGTASPPTFSEAGGRPGNPGSRPGGVAAQGHGLGVRPAPGGRGPLGSVLPKQPPVGGLTSFQGTGGVSPLDVFEGICALLLAWALLVPSLRRVLDRRRRKDPVTGVVASWRSVVRSLQAAGFHRRRAETRYEFAKRVRLSGSLPAPGEAALGRLVAAADEASFGRSPLSSGAVSRASSDADEISRASRRSVKRWQRIMLELDPRDLRDGT